MLLVRKLTNGMPLFILRTEPELCLMELNFNGLIMRPLHQPVSSLREIEELTFPMDGMDIKSITWMLLFICQMELEFNQMAKKFNGQTGNHLTLKRLPSSCNKDPMKSL